jgi:YggT family protein
MTSILIPFIQVTEQVFSLLVITHVILSYFMSPYHPVRSAIDRAVEPFLAPIRRVVPLVGMFDFSPLVLLILVQLIATVLINILLSLR